MTQAKVPYSMPLDDADEDAYEDQEEYVDRIVDDDDDEDANENIDRNIQAQQYADQDEVVVNRHYPDHNIPHRADDMEMDEVYDEEEDEDYVEDADEHVPGMHDDDEMDDDEEMEGQDEMDQQPDESASLVQNGLSQAPAPGASGLLRHVPGQTNLHAANSAKNTASIENVSNNRGVGAPPQPVNAQYNSGAFAGVKGSKQGGLPPQQQDAVGMEANARRMRPQSAKTAQMSNQLHLQQQQLTQQAQQHNLGQNQWPNTTQSQQNQNQLSGGYSHQALLNQQQASNQYQQSQNFFYPQPQSTTKARSGNKRPGTASRKSKPPMGPQGVAAGAQNMRGQSINSGLSVYAPANQLPIDPRSFTNLAGQRMAEDIVKLRPRVVLQERERLYDDIMAQRIEGNALRDDNTKLRTRIQIMEAELNRKDRTIDEMIQAADQQALSGVSAKQQALLMGKRQPETHLTTNLKRKIRELQSELGQRKDEVELLKRNIKNTRTHETEIEIKLYMDECIRLRQQLEEVIKSKDTFADPQELKIIEQKFLQRDQVIARMSQETNDLRQAFQVKDDENRQLASLVQEMERRYSKAKQASKGATRARKEGKENERQMHRMRKELIDLKDQNRQLHARCVDLSSGLPVQAQKPVARAQSAHPSNQANTQQNQQQAAEIRRLTHQLNEEKNSNQSSKKLFDQTSAKLKKAQEDLATTNQDLQRFKGMSENYMQDIARLEQQLEQADIKPKSKMSTRPKDTMKRDAHSSYSNGGKQKRVDPKQLQDVISLMKLKLQEQELVSMQSHLLVFAPYDEDASVSIRQLKLRFEQLGVNPKKALLVARYLIEPKETKQQQTSADYAATVVLNEDLEKTQKGIVDDMYDLIGPYKIYIDSEEKRDELNEEETAMDYANEFEMRHKVAGRFARCKTTLMECLSCEDYDGEGQLDYVQLKEAILSVTDEGTEGAPSIGIDQHLLDYMLWYVYVRSDSVERMEYKALMQLIAEEEDKKVEASIGKNEDQDKKQLPEKKLSGSSPQKKVNRVPKRKESSDSNGGGLAQLKGLGGSDSSESDCDNYDDDADQDDNQDKYSNVEEDERIQEGALDLLQDDDDDLPKSRKPSTASKPKTQDDKDKQSKDSQKQEEEDAPEMQSDDNDPLMPQKDSYEDSPRQKLPGQSQAADKKSEEQDDEEDEEANPDYPEAEEEFDEDEMIDVAEKIFIRVAEQIIHQSTTVREIFKSSLFPAVIDGDEYELLTPMGLLEGVKDLGIDDLSELEVQYLLKVLSKPELDGAILMQELLQIMENFGLYDEGGSPAPPGLQPEYSDAEDQAQPKNLQRQQPDEIAAPSSNQESSPDPSSSKKQKSSEKALDLSKMDQKSVKIMVTLMLHLLENNMTTAEFFASVTYQQNVKSKTKQQTLDIMKADDFFGLLHESGIRKKDASHDNLQDFLKLSPSFPDLIVLKSIKRTLEQMAENEEFMDAIREDIMLADEHALQQMDPDEREAYLAELAAMEQEMEDDEDYSEESPIRGENAKLQTVGEETNQTNTQEKNGNGSALDQNKPPTHQRPPAQSAEDDQSNEGSEYDEF